MGHPFSKYNHRLTDRQSEVDTSENRALVTIMSTLSDFQMGRNHTSYSAT